MAALTATAVTKKLPIGDRFIQTFSVTGAGAAAADEWVATGFSWIDTAFEPVVIGTAPFADVSTSADPVSANVVLNAQGTGVAAGTNPGDLGLEVPQSGKTLHVTVIGY